jgi:hypothetical protein
MMGFALGLILGWLIACSSMLIVLRFESPRKEDDNADWWKNGSQKPY